MPEIDEQHRRIIALAEEIRNGKDMTDGLIELVEYATSHFRVEEKAMIDAFYPDFDAHQRAHLTFFDRLIHLRARWKKNPTPESVTALVDEVEAWLRDHVLGSDVRMADHLRVVVRNTVGQ